MLYSLYFEAQLLLGQYRFSVGPEFDAALARARRVYADRLGNLDELARFIAALAPEYAEILTTLFAVWNDLLAAGKPAQEQDIIAEFYCWHPGKAKFEPTRLPKALAYMREHGYVPTGAATVCIDPEPGDGAG